MTASWACRLQTSVYCVPRDALSSPALEWNPRVIAPGLRPLGPSLQTKHSDEWIAPVFCARPPPMPAKQSFCTTIRLCSRGVTGGTRTPAATDRRCSCKAATTSCLRAVLCCRQRGSCVTLWPGVASQGSWKYGVSWSPSTRWRLSQPVCKFQRPPSVNQHMGQPTVTNDETKSQVTRAL